MDAPDLLAEQIAYYRARAPEYEKGAPPPPEPVSRRVADAVPRGADVLELACGTGVWTSRLAARAGRLTAVDAAPEMIELARSRVPDAEFVCADVLSWRPPHRYDVVFFGAWLSHVPAQRFAYFWTLVGDCLRADGRAVFVDEPVTVAGKERWLAGEVVERTLSDGSTHRIVKTYFDPDELTARLADLGWAARVESLDPQWVLGEAHRSGPIA